MSYKAAHSVVDPEAAIEHLRKDPGLPFSDPLPSLWQEPPTKPIAAHQSQQLPSETDVVIIGSGITGASIARHLLGKDDKINIVMLEARTITSGATGRNGGHVMVAPELFYVGLAAAKGKEVAKEFIKFAIDNQDALLDLGDTLPTGLKESSELRRLEVLHVFSSKLARENAESWIAILASDYPDLKRRCKIVSKEEMLEKYGISDSFGGATMPAGAAWPYRLITGILTDLWQKYSRRFAIEANTPAESITWSSESQQYSVQTPRGVITAKNVIHATNSHAGHLLPAIRGFLHPIRCQVSVQEKAPGSENRGSQNTFVITNPRSLLSIYQSPQTGDLYASGLTGTGNFFDEFNPHEDKNDEPMIAGLSTIMNKKSAFPVQGRVKANWTGVMGYTADGAPLVGRVGQDISGRGGQGEYISAGYNGVGMVTAWLSGEHIADVVLGKAEPRKIPSHFAVSKERVEETPLETILVRPYGTWE